MARRLVLNIRILLALMALVLPGASLVALAIGALLFDRGALGLEPARVWLLASAAAGAGGLIALLLGRSAGWISWRWMLLLAVPALVPIATAAAAADWVRRHPSMAQISTDLIDPPAFAGKATALPAGLAEVQRRRHPQVQSATLKAQPAEAHAHALSLAQAMGWTVTSASASDGVIEGYGRFGRFGDRREWVLRIRPELSGGSLVDMRLRSASDTPDFGHNAEVVAAFLKRLSADAG